MKKILKASFFAVAAWAVSFPVLAEQTANVGNEAPDYYQQDARMGMDERNGTASSVNAENTARNARDRDRSSVTPFDQGNNQADIDVTAAIRKDIMDRKGMSVDAQNVKIMTRNGRVTLRGSVKTAEEKNIIAEIVRNRAVSGNIDDQLEVAGDTRNVTNY